MALLLKKGKRGSIDPAAPDIVTRPGHTQKQWQSLVSPQVSQK